MLPTVKSNNIKLQVSILLFITSYINDLGLFGGVNKDRIIYSTNKVPNPLEQNSFVITRARRQDCTCFASLGMCGGLSGLQKWWNVRWGCFFFFFVRGEKNKISSYVSKSFSSG